jgi:Ni,Fe-hydrogenase III large subunit
MTSLAELLHAGTLVEGHRPWPRAIATRAVWQTAASELSRGHLDLAGLWGDDNAVHMALRDPAIGDAAVLTMICSDRTYPSIGAVHPPAIRLERAIRDLFGLEAEGAPDLRPWLDHGRWGIAQPLGEPRPAPVKPSLYTFLPTEGENLHQISVGPVHAGIIEPGHFRFTAAGETVVRLEERLGYAHKGIEQLMKGAELERASMLAGRTSGDSTVAYQIAFARAAEAALALPVPPRADWLRALMAELERLANHLGDIGDVCNDASFAIMQAHCAVLRERILRTADSLFSHRLMRDCVVPGGVTSDLSDAKIAAVRDLLTEIGARFPALVALYDNTASLQDRTVTTGTLRPDLARQFAAGGYVGRASGRKFDARRSPGYPPYDEIAFEVPVRQDGDVNGRVWIRIREIEQSLAIIRQIVERIPEGPVSSEITSRNPETTVEGVAVIEGFRGDILVWLRIGRDLHVERCHLRDPSWFQWPLLEAAIEGNIVADFPLCNKSFNCSYSGHDL